jgi:hypothetical protein
VTVRVRVDAGREAVADSADIGLDVTGDRQRVTVLGDQGSNQIIERGSLPVAHYRKNRADQRSQQFKGLSGLLQDGRQDPWDAVMIVGFPPRSGVSLPFSPPCACRERRAVSLRTGTRFGLPRRELVGAGYSEGVRKPGPKSTKGALVHMDNQPMALLCRGRDVAVAVP